jgi:hypothetical protein
MTHHAARVGRMVEAGSGRRRERRRSCSYSRAEPTLTGDRGSGSKAKARRDGGYRAAAITPKVKLIAPPSHGPGRLSTSIRHPANVQRDALALLRAAAIWSIFTATGRKMASTSSSI